MGFLRLLVIWMSISGVLIEHCEASKYADQLYEDLMYYYNKNVRPVVNSTEALKVKFGASLIRIIDVDEINQVLTTNLWLEMQWYDYKLKWDPTKFNNIRKLHLPSDQIWIPDILLYNNADGEPHISIMSDAIVYYTGLVVWKPPSIYKSFCSIDIKFFPYDIQTCAMKFGGWSYNGFLMDITQLPNRPTDQIITKYDAEGRDYQFLNPGMELSAYNPSLEWDVVALTSERHEQVYPGCCGQYMYIDITFEMILRRKALFYTVNLVIPCVLFAILTTFVFYIPLREHKVTFSISVLVTLTVFYLVLIDLIPPTSLVIPLIGKYLLFTMLLVTSSIICSVIILNFFRRDAATHQMSSWVKKLFLKKLPGYLCIKLPEDDALLDDEGSSLSVSEAQSPTANTSRRPSPYFFNVSSMIDSETRLSQLAQLRGMHPDVIRRMIDNVAFIADHYRAKRKRDKIAEEWTYVAMVIDRILLILFTAINCAGTISVLSQAHAVFDTREPLQILPATKPLSGDTFEHFLLNSSFI